jgi:hypothetical protein
MNRRRALIILLGIHVAVTTAVCLAGKFSFAPRVLDSNGIVISSDNLEFHPEVISQAKVLRGEGILAYTRIPSPFHLKLYSFSFAIFGPLFGNTILSAEPINALLYLAIVCLMFKLSRLICSRETSLVAAGAVAVWPSFLIHTTQLLRDPLFIAAMLLLVFIAASLLARDYSWRTALVRGFIGAASAAVLWVVRAGAKEVLIAVAVLCGVLLLARQITERRLLMANTVGAVIVILACLIIPKFITPYHPPLKTGDSPTPASAETSLTPNSDQAQLSMPGEPGRRAEDLEASEATKIGRLRDRFIDQYRDAGSNIDTGVRFNSATDIVRYIPRATAIGLFAPFPQMWFSIGNNTGTAGRLAAGIETLVMYVIELLAVFGVWKMRRQWVVWLLLSVALIGAISLGLVVTNIGALYRMRYAFWMLILPLGAEGARQARDLWLAKRERAVQESC